MNSLDLVNIPFILLNQRGKEVLALSVTLGHGQSYGRMCSENFVSFRVPLS